VGAGEMTCVPTGWLLCKYAHHSMKHCHFGHTYEHEDLSSVNQPTGLRLPLYLLLYKYYKLQSKQHPPLCVTRQQLPSDSVVKNLAVVSEQIV